MTGVDKKGSPAFAYFLLILISLFLPEWQQSSVSFTYLNVYKNRPKIYSISGWIFLSIASRARKIRERTVPIGQSIASAISS